jgi:hypothetical protein
VSKERALRASNPVKNLAALCKTILRDTTDENFGEHAEKRFYLCTWKRHRLQFSKNHELQRCTASLHIKISEVSKRHLKLSPAGVLTD